MIKIRCGVFGCIFTPLIKSPVCLVLLVILYDRFPFKFVWFCILDPFVIDLLYVLFGYVCLNPFLLRTLSDQVPFLRLSLSVVSLFPRAS